MGSPQGEYWRRKTRGNVHLERGAFIHLGVGGPSRQDQASEVQMLGCLSFLCGIENNLLCWTCRRKVESSVHSPCSSLGLPGKGPPQRWPLPALCFSDPLERCSKPQAGIAASRHRASSSSSSLLLLLLDSLMAPLGAAILAAAGGCGERRHQATSAKAQREAQGIMGIVVLRLWLPLLGLMLLGGHFFPQACPKRLFSHSLFPNETRTKR